MLQTKNLSPKKLALLTALILSIPIAAGIYILENSFLIGAVSFLLIFAGSYFLIHTIIQNFIYRKIKLIYKFIYQTKATKREETYYKYVLPSKSIDDVREDVEAWARQRTNEVEMLKKNEIFRKEFLQNLSHEFKTPVFALQGYIDILRQSAFESDETNRRYLEKAGKNIERLGALLNDLDEISKLERGEINIYRQHFIIHDIIKEAYDSLSYKAEKNNIHFSFKKGCETPFPVFADKEKIRQVICNLVDNSIKYSKNNGNIIASIYNTDDNTILLEISDDGIGIHESQLNRIFERFYRTPTARNRDRKGSGLGLAICKHIIEAHGHTIHVRSKEDVGTSIGFTLDVGRI